MCEQADNVREIESMCLREREKEQEGEHKGGGKVQIEGNSFVGLCSSVHPW